MSGNSEVCPKCGKAMLDENIDGDLECVNCGKIVYKNRIPVGKSKVKGGLGAGDYKRRY